ncbi:lytic transglycosylase domain-containing protein [Roseobacter sp. OBYS 0001]|uniref:lytic transglycosylase domain-containing protein n=1 Tax=Roseobacter sp. OBYS 0001 TaxID=882651 RepID=UPI001C821867|nr:lytic transglycosylase domain-containing protein [Roseobacter sp. OBYS 0001]
MQVIRRLFISLVLVLITALPVSAERPRPLGWALDSARSGNWQAASRIAARDGQVAADVIEWMRLRDGLGTYEEVAAFLERRPDWPGERYLRRKSETTLMTQSDDRVISFFEETPPQSPQSALRFAKALKARQRTDEAEAIVIGAWRNMAMGASDQAEYIAAHGRILSAHHDARLDSMLWQGAVGNARRMFDMASKGAVAAAKARLALREETPGVDTLIAAVPDSNAKDGGLQYERFMWRVRKGRRVDAKDLMLATSVSAERLGRPESWSNRRRSLARYEMRNGSAERAYELASRHFLTGGSAYSDLEWLAGYIALQKLQEPQTALKHFENHDAAVRSPISKGRAGYWRGRAYEAMGDVAAADQAYASAAQHQTSFYGLLAAERAGLPFDLELAVSEPAEDWRTSNLAKTPLFEAGLLLQASGELNLAERFWTHLAESLDAQDGALLAKAAVDAGQPHLAVMIGKRLAQRAIVVPYGYYALHPLAQRALPMAPEMSLAIARRESEFDARVQSGVGARGLMQIMPRTGAEVARQLGRASEHTTQRLISDPVYNAELGAAYLSTLARRFSGNVIMMSAGYNAGPSRPDRWMEDYGDPRRGDVEIVDWIEHIPFRETRNYVMRVSESLPIYRAQLGKAPLLLPFSEELTGSSLLKYAPKGE